MVPLSYFKRARIQLMAVVSRTLVLKVLRFHLLGHQIGPEPQDCRVSPNSQLEPAFDPPFLLYTLFLCEISAQIRIQVTIVTFLWCQKEGCHVRAEIGFCFLVVALSSCWAIQRCSRRLGGLTCDTVSALMVIIGHQDLWYPSLVTAWSLVWKEFASFFPLFL